MSRGWRANVDPAVASLIERYAPELLESDGRVPSDVVRSTAAILRDGRDADLEDELLEELLVDHLLDQGRKVCRR